MTKRIYTFLAILLVISSFIGNANATLNIYDSPRTVPNKFIFNENNKQFKLSNFDGQFLIAVFWSRNCSPCLKEMESLNNFSNKAKGDGIRVIIISSAGEWIDDDEHRRFVEKYKGQDLERYVDKKGDLAGDLGIFTSPNTVLVNKRGEEIGRIRGAVEWDDEEVVEYLYKIKAQNN